MSIDDIIKQEAQARALLEFIVEVVLITEEKQRAKQSLKIQTPVPQKPILPTTDKFVSLDQLKEIFRHG